MIRPPRPPHRGYDFRVRRSWKRSYTYKKGIYTKRRWALETALAEAMPKLKRLAEQLRDFGRWGRTGSPARNLLNALIETHPSQWTLQYGTSKLWLPTNNIATAASWLRRVAELERMLGWIALQIAGFRARLSFSGGNDLRTDHDRQSREQRSKSVEVQTEIQRLKRWAAAVGEPWHGNGPVIIRE